jgi:6-phosphogluconolactonase
MKKQLNFGVAFIFILGLIVMLAGCGNRSSKSPVAPARYYVYVAATDTDIPAGVIEAYTIDSATGALTAITGSPFITSASAVPMSITADPARKFLYVANYDGTNGTISVYTINADTGALTEVKGNLTYTNQDYPVSITVDPTGKFAYIANMNSDNISAYTINSATGALTEVIGSPFATGSTPQSITVDPTGKFVYVVNRGDNNISAYTIDSLTGALTNQTYFTSGAAPSAITVDPAGKFVYVANYECTISVYTINATTGALTNVTNSLISTTPMSITVDPSGKFIYVANSNVNNILAYTINSATGALTDIPGSPFPAGTFPVSITVDPTGKFVYVANKNDGTISAYTINAATGALTVIGSPIKTGSDPTAIFVVKK